MPSPLKLSKADVARALAIYHFTPAASQAEVFDRLGSIQFDPIAPVGCNHDLVLQARLPGYRIGDWQKIAYEDRLVYDGWDKQASLVPFEGWPWRRLYYSWYRNGRRRIFDEHPEAVEAILKELAERGPLMPKECEFQGRREDLKDTWYGASVTKQVLRALWHSGQIMTAGRKRGQHVYDLTERVVPLHLYHQPELTEAEAIRRLLVERHRAVGLLRPNAPYEVWSYQLYAGPRKAAIQGLVDEGELVPVDVEGLTTHASPEFLKHLDAPVPQPRVVFVAPLDQFVWDRGMVGHIFNFDYIWEIYVPEAKRRWGYYVLPVLYGDALVARVEFWSRKGVLEIRNWHWEAQDPSPSFLEALEPALRDFMAYSSSQELQVGPNVDAKTRTILRRMGTRIAKELAPRRAKRV